MVITLIWWVRLEAGKLERQAATLRQAMGEPSGPGRPGV
jgi:hypothetical protein